MRSGSSPAKVQPSAADVRHNDPRDTILGKLSGTVGSQRSKFEAGPSDPQSELRPAGKLDRGWDPNTDYQLQQRGVGQLGSRMRSGSALERPTGGAAARGRTAANAPQSGAFVKEPAPSSADVRYDDRRETFYDRLTGTVDPRRQRFETGDDGYSSSTQEVGKLDRSWNPNTDYETRQRDVGKLGTRPTESSDQARLQSGTFVKQPQPARVDARHDDKRETFYDQLAGTVDPRKAQWEAGRGGGSPAPSAPPGKLTRGWNPNTDFETAQRDVGRLDINERPEGSNAYGRDAARPGQQSGEFVKEPEPRPVDARYGDRRETYYDKLAGTLPGRLAALGEQAPSDAQKSDVGRLDRGWNPNSEFDTQQRDVGRLNRPWDPSDDYESQQRSVGQLPPRDAARSGDSHPRGVGPTGRAVSGAFVKEGAPTRADVRHDDPRDTYYPHLGGGVHPLRDRFGNPVEGDDSGPRQVGKLNRPWDPRDDWERQQRDVGRLQIPDGGGGSDSDPPGRGRPLGRGLPADTGGSPHQREAGRLKFPGAEAVDPSVLEREGGPSRADVRHDDPRDTYYPHLGGTVNPIRDRFGKPDESGSGPRQVGKLNRPWNPKDDWETRQREVGRLDIPESSSGDDSGHPRGSGDSGAGRSPEDGQQGHQRQPGKLNLPGASPVSAQALSPRQVGKLGQRWDPKDDWESQQRDVGRLPPHEPVTTSPGGLSHGQAGTVKPSDPHSAQVGAPRQVGKLIIPDTLAMSPATSVSPRQVGKLNRTWDPKDDWETQQRDVGTLPPHEPVTTSPGGLSSGTAGAVRPRDAHDGDDGAPRQVGKLIIPDALALSPATAVSPRQVGKLNRPWDPKDDWESQQRDVGRLPESAPVSSSPASQPATQVGKLQPRSPPTGGTAAQPRQVGKLLTPQAGSMTPVSPVSPRQVGKLNHPWDPKDDWEGQQRQVGKLPAAEAVSASSVPRPSQQVGKLKPWDPQTSGGDTEPRQVGKLSVLEPASMSPVSPRQVGQVHVPEAIAARAVPPVSPRTAHTSRPGDQCGLPGRTVYGSSTTTSPGTMGTPSTRTAPVVPVRGVAGIVASQQGVVPRGSGVGMSDFGRSGRPHDRPSTSGSGGSGSSRQEKTVHHPQQLPVSRTAPAPGHVGGGSPSQSGGTFMPLTAVGGGGGGKSEFEPGWDYGKVRIGAKKMDLTDNLYTGEVKEFYDPTGVKDHCPKCGVKRAGRDRFCPTDGALYNQ